MKERSIALRLILDWLLVTLGVLGSLFCLITAFELPVPDGTLLVVITTSVFDCCLFSTKRSTRIAAPIVFAGLLIFIFLLRAELTESFRNLWGELSRRYARGYDWVLNYLPRERTRAEDCGVALLAMGIVMTFPLSLSVRRWNRSFPAALSLLPGILPCFVLTDTPPALLPLLTAVGTVLVQVFSQIVRRRDAGEECKSIVLSALIAAGLLGLLLLIFPPKKNFKPPLTWKQLSKKMEQWSREQRDRGNQVAGLSGNPEDVDLSGLEALPNHASTVLQVRSDRSDFVYLRGSAYSGFDGTNWSRDTERSWPERTVFPWLGSEGDTDLSVTTMEREPALYTVYQLAVLPEGGEPVSDSYLNNGSGRMTYKLRYCFDPGRALRQSPKEYEAWVQERCLELPEQTREGVLAWWAAQGGELLSGPELSTVVIGISDGDLASSGLVISNDSFSAVSLEDYVKRVAATVSGCAAYSRTPLRVPEGVDFCTWFLNEAEEGYCVHFASSCAALLRALGIPARYASGYVTPTEAGKTVSVTSLQAHAWVEAWVGGRWIVVEPTPDSATEFSGEGVGVGGPVDPLPEESTEDWRQRPDSTRPSGPEATDAPVTKPTRSPSSSTEAQPSGGGSGAGEPRDLTALWVFLGVVGLLALVLGRRQLALHLRERRLARASVNDRARLLYRYILRLHRLGGGAVPEEAKQLAQKAGFSQYELDANELFFLRQLYDQQVGRLGIAGFFKRFYCKYILAVI